MSNIPTVSTPTYFMTLPSTGKDYKYRPYFVKEEKVLAMALQESDPRVIFETVKDVIKACTFSQIDPDKITSYDMEYIFLQLRMKSKGEIVPLVFQCNNDVSGEDNAKTPCGHKTNIPFDLKNVSVQGVVKGNNKIIIEGSIGIIMRHPTASELNTLPSDMDSTDLIAKYVDSIFDGEKVFEEITADEIKEFLESLTSKQFELVLEFFKTIPKLASDIHVNCTKCGHQETVKLEGLRSFLEF